MFGEIGDQPQFERVDARDIAPVGEVETLGGVGQVKIPQLFRVQLLARQMGGEKRLQMREAGIGMERQIDRRQPLRDRAGSLYQLVERLVGVEAFVVAVEPRQKAPAVGVDKAAQIGLALRVRRIAEQALDLNPARRRLVERDVVQEPDKGEVDRMVKCLFDRWVAGILR